MLVALLCPAAERHHCQAPAPARRHPQADGTAAATSHPQCVDGHSCSARCQPHCTVGDGREGGQEEFIQGGGCRFVPILALGVRTPLFVSQSVGVGLQGGHIITLLHLWEGGQEQAITHHSL